MTNTTITIDSLKTMVLNLNKQLGTPESKYNKTFKVFNIGNLHLHKESIHGYSLRVVKNQAGGTDVMLPSGNKRELYWNLQAFIKGLNYSRRILLNSAE